MGFFESEIAERESGLDIQRGRGGVSMCVSLCWRFLE